MNIHSDIGVAALIRRASLEGAFAAVTRRGDARAGAVLVRVWNSRSREMALYVEALDAEGRSIWLQPIAATAETDIEAYVQRAIRNDPDIWVVDIEDSAGRHFLVEPVAVR
jgi:hypothetical protein